MGDKEASGTYTLTVHSDVPLTLEVVEEHERTVVAEWEELGIEALGAKHIAGGDDDDSNF